jgi:CubicO group peptidase (beta-lactamase class C family)
LANTCLDYLNYDRLEVCDLDTQLEGGRAGAAGVVSKSWNYTAPARLSEVYGLKDRGRPCGSRTFIHIVGLTGREAGGAPTMTKMWMQSFVVFWVLTYAASTASAAQNDLRRIDTAVETRVSKEQFMGAVLIARDGRVLLSKGYGKANLEWGIPNSPATRYRLGSVTKQFTAASVLLLEERGKLKIGDPIGNYMAHTPAAWGPITVFNLLTHTSGIPELTTFPDFDASERFPTTPEKLVERFRDKSLDFPPGTDFRYSNSGYILLGYLIEKITGQSYRQFIQENIFGPLDMKNSGYDSNVDIIDRHAEGYSLANSGWAVADYVDMTIPFAAGGLYSTTEDMLRWERDLYGGKLLSPASLARMTTPFKKDYAFGLAVDQDANGRKVFWHGGAIEGFSSYVAYVPTEKLAVIVLANLEETAARDTAIEILRILGHEWTPQK